MRKEPETPETAVIGPYRPQLLEPERFELTMENGRITDVKIERGYVNRGIEKLFTTKTYMQNLALAERVCGICSGVHSLCYAQTAEGIMQVTVPDRAKFLRSIYMELERLHSHYLWFAVLAHSLHKQEIFLRIMAERDQLQNLMEYLTGNRKNYGINSIGGVRRDITREKEAKIAELFTNMETLSEYLLSLIDDNGILTKEIKGLGILTGEQAQSLGVVGPVARASGLKRDTRRDDPYVAYEELDFEVISEKDGDVYSRSLVRAKETVESINIIEQALSNIPTGDIAAKPEEPLERESICRVEAPRGELFYYMRSNGTNIPERVKVRTPSFANNPALIEMLKGELLENARTVIESIDPCFACTDRVTVLESETGHKVLLLDEEGRS